MGKNIGKNISKKLSGKYKQNLLDHAIQSATVRLKPLQKKQLKKQQMQLISWLVIELLIKLRGFERTRRQNNSKQAKRQSNSETVSRVHGKDIPKKRYISPEKNTRNYWWFKINTVE